ATGGNGMLTARFRVPAHQLARLDPGLVPPWVWFLFGTPRLRARFEALDLTWARLFLAAAMASSPAEQATVERAAARVPAELLTSDDNALRAGLAEVADQLLEFDDAVRGMRVHVIGHSHID